MGGFNRTATAIDSCIELLCGAIENPIKAEIERQQTEQLDLLAWTLKYRKWLEADRQFDLVNHAYLEDIYRVTGAKESAPQSPEICYFKAGQMGISEMMISYALWMCEVRQATGLYLFPDAGGVSDFSAGRLGPALDASEHLTAIVKDGKEDGGSPTRRGTDRVTLKRIGNRFLYLRGATVKPDGKAPQLKSVPADFIINDELDEMDPRARSIAKKRLGHSKIAHIRDVSTPSWYGVGIHERWLLSDQRHWLIKCESCNHRQSLSIDNLVYEWDDAERPAGWYVDQHDRPCLVCTECEAQITPASKRGGEWIAEYPDREVVGFHIPKFIGEFANLKDILDALSSSSETVRKECYNQDLGKAYSPRGGGLTPEHLAGCVREYTAQAGHHQGCVMGVDVGSVYHVVIRGRQDPETGERRLLLATTVPNTEDVGRLIRQFRPVSVVIDALPETREVRGLQADFRPGLIWVCYYKEAEKGESSVRVNEEESTIQADRTRTLDETVSRFIEGSNALPHDIEAVADYEEQVCAPKRVMDKSKRDNQEVARYVSASTDHYAHAENYATIASDVIGGATLGRLNLREIFG